MPKAMTIIILNRVAVATAYNNRVYVPVSLSRSNLSARWRTEDEDKRKSLQPSGTANSVPNRCRGRVEQPNLANHATGGLLHHSVYYALFVCVWSIDIRKSSMNYKCLDISLRSLSALSLV